MKKSSRVLLVMIASLYAISGTVSAQAAEIKVMESEDAPPVLSFGQVRELRNNFVSWLNKHYRCLYAGKCTRAEKAQVTAEWSRWIKRLGFTAVVGLAYYFGKPKAQQAAQHVSQQMQKMHPTVVIAAVLDELLAQQGDVPGQPLDATERRERLARFGGQITKNAIDGIADSIEEKILAEDRDPAAASLTAAERRERMMDITQNAVKAALAIPAGQEIGQEGVVGHVVRQVLDELESREVELPFGRRARIVSSTRSPEGAEEAAAERTTGWTSWLGAGEQESAEGSQPEVAPTVDPSLGQRSEQPRGWFEPDYY